MNNLINSNVGVAGVVVVGGLVAAAFVAFGAKRAVEGAVTAINPMNNDNIFASGVNNVGARLTGNNNWSLGGAIYDMVNGSPSEQTERIQEDLFIKSIGG